MTMITTLGEAYDARWSIRMRCRRGEHRGPTKIDPCEFETEICLKTLVATRRRAFPIARIADRVRCPNCGDLGVVIAFDVPGSPIPIFKPTVYGRRVG
jgi:hypothetical protein